jgi:ABC-2 type transport system ATP-binding protein
MNKLTIDHVSKHFYKHTALSNVSFNVREKSIFGLLGPNGAGKTTLIRIINQIISSDSGEVRLDGELLRPEHIENIGYLPEERGLYKKMKVGEQAIYLAQLKGMTYANAIEQLKIWFTKFNIIDWWDKKVEELSKGMAQKIQFITTVVHQPKLLILDEPFSGFDPINTNLIKKEILELRDNGATVILSTHNMGSVEEICDEIVLIDQSEIILEGRVDELRTRFKPHEYEIVFNGNILGFTNAMWTDFELMEKVKYNGTTKARVKLLNNKTLNDLLKIAIENVDIVEVKEVLPSMNDIFIAAVEQKNHQIEETKP